MKKLYKIRWVPLIVNLVAMLITCSIKIETTEFASPSERLIMQRSMSFVQEEAAKVTQQMVFIYFFFFMSVLGLIFALVLRAIHKYQEEKEMYDDIKD